MKICSTCKKPKVGSEFAVRSDTKAPRRQCRTCVSVCAAALREKDPEPYRRRSLARYYRTLEQSRKRAKEYRKMFPTVWKLWNKNNKPKLRVIQRRHLKKKYRENPTFKISCNLRSRLGMALRGHGVTKRGTTFELLGCSVAELRTHLTSLFRPGMTWENHGPVWHIDHIKPCAKFDLRDLGQQKACFHWTNLQPLFVLENLLKGAA